MSDLTKITTPLGLLDAETQEALKAHGGPYEVFYAAGRWLEMGVSRSWDRHITYRVKPQPATPMTIPWEAIKPEWKWAAKDEDRVVWVFTVKPVPATYRWLTSVGNIMRICPLIKMGLGTCDWRDSLQQRPEGKP